MKKVEKVDSLFEFLRVFLGIVIAFLICVIIISIMSGSDAGEAVKNFMVGPFMSTRRFGQVMAKWASYMLAGMGMCFIYAAGRLNMAGEGVINLAPIPALIVMFGTSFGISMMPGLPRFFNLVILVSICMITGATILMVPAFGREQLGANEVVTSSIINMFCLYAALWIIKSTVADRKMAYLGTSNYPDNERFARYWNGSNFTSGFWLALVGVVIGIVIFYWTSLGIKIRICGDNLSFAKYSGINAKRMIYLAQLIGGLFAGAAAAVEVFGLYDAYYLSLLTNVGMDGLIVAVMAKKKPIFVPITAFVMAYIRQAAAVLNANTNIPIELVTMLSSVIILFVAAEEFLGGARRKVIFKISEEAELASKKGGEQNA